MKKITKILSCLAHPLSRRALRLGVSPAFEHAALMRTLRIQTVVDVGANKGQFALLARLIWPDSTIVSFEPLPRPAKKFRQVFSGAAHISLAECAVGESTCEMEIHESARDD